LLLSKLDIIFVFNMSIRMNTVNGINAFRNGAATTVSTNIYYI
jgi:hypothetical protein